MTDCYATLMLLIHILSWRGTESLTWYNFRVWLSKEYCKCYNGWRVECILNPIKWRSLGEIVRANTNDLQKRYAVSNDTIAVCLTVFKYRCTRLLNCISIDLRQTMQWCEVSVINCYRSKMQIEPWKRILNVYKPSEFLILTTRQLKYFPLDRHSDPMKSINSNKNPQQWGKTVILSRQYNNDIDTWIKQKLIVPCSS